MLCRICNRPIHILIRQGTGLCCNLCEDVEVGKLTPDQILVYIAQVNPTQYRRVMEAKYDRQ